MIKPIWQPMETMPEGVFKAWLYSEQGVQLCYRHVDIPDTWTISAAGQPHNGRRMFAPLRWTAFLKPEPPEGFHL